MYPRYYEEYRDDKNTFYFKYNINDVAEPHFHKNIELLFVQEGKIEVVINGIKKTLTKGMIAISNSFDVHKYSTIGYSESYVMLIGEKYCGRFFSLENNCFANYLSPCSVTDRIFELLKTYSEENKTYNEMMSFGFCNYLLGILSNFYGLENKKRNVSNNVLI